RRAELDALVGVLATPDDTVMASSGAIAAELTSPDACALVDSLAAIQDPTNRETVEALEARMATGAALLAAKRFDAARDELTATRAATSYKPLVAELELALGELDL